MKNTERYDNRGKSSLNFPRYLCYSDGEWLSWEFIMVRNFGKVLLQNWYAKFVIVKTCWFHLSAWHFLFATGAITVGDGIYLSNFSIWIKFGDLNLKLRGGKKIWSFTGYCLTTYKYIIKGEASYDNFYLYNWPFSLTSLRLIEWSPIWLLVYSAQV